MSLKFCLIMASILRYCSVHGEDMKDAGIFSGSMISSSIISKGLTSVSLGGKTYIAFPFDFYYS